MEWQTWEQGPAKRLLEFLYFHQSLKGRMGRKRKGSNSVRESPNLLLTMEGQTRRQIGKGLKLNLHCFSLAMEITLCGIIAQEGETLTLSVWKMVLGMWHM
jgi:hypothetical protein